VIEVSKEGCHVPVYLGVEGETELVELVILRIRMLAINSSVNVVYLISVARIVAVLFKYVQAKSTEIELGRALAESGGVRTRGIVNDAVATKGLWSRI
jgi:hypothetical protein